MLHHWPKGMHRGHLYTTVRRCRTLLVGTAQTSPLFIRMYPIVRRNLPLLRQLDYAGGRLVTACAAGPASEGRLQLPDRRVTRPADGIQRHACPCLAPAAFDLQPTVTTVQALADGWARLRWPAIAFHADRPCFDLRSISGASGFPSLLASRLGAELRAHDLATPDDLACLGAHTGITAAAMPLRNPRHIAAHSACIALAWSSVSLPANGKLGGHTTTARCCL